MRRRDPTRRSADLQAFVDELYGKGRPAGVADTLIDERRREARAEADAE